MPPAAVVDNLYVCAPAVTLVLVGLPRQANQHFLVFVTDEFDDRALWLVRTVLPHEPALRSWLRTRRIVDLDIDDIVQETYSKLVSMDSVASIRDIRAYTFRIAFSIMAQHVRHARVVSIHTAADLDQFGVETPEPSPERQVEDRDELRRLAAALDSMPGRSRQVFILRRLEGLSQREAAQKLGLSEKTLEKHMSAGIRHLMEFFGRGGKVIAQASIERTEAPKSTVGRKIDEPGDR
jgi:RNA polymerase sigma factor (sigma-70 family)